MVERPVRQDAKSEPLTGRGLHFHFFGNQTVEHGLRVGHQCAVIDKIRNNVTHRSPDIALNQINHLGDRRCKPQDAQLLVHKHRADPGPAQQIVHVVVQPRQIRHLGLQLGIHRVQFLVHRLQFFLGSLQLFVGGLQLLVHRLHFFIGRFHLFVSCLQLLIGRLQIFFLGAQLPFERRNPRIHVFRRRLVRRSSRYQTRCSDRRRIFQQDNVKRRLNRHAPAVRHRTNRQIHQREIAIGFYTQSRPAHQLVRDHSLLECGGQFAP